MEKLVDAERERARAALKYTRGTLGNRIELLEARLLEGVDSFSTNKEKKKWVEKAMTRAQRDGDESRAQAARDSRRIESLEGQLKRSKEREEELVETKNDLELGIFQKFMSGDSHLTELYHLRREVNLLGVQFNAAIHINASAVSFLLGSGLL